MAYDTLTGHVIADVNYRVKQIDDTSHFEEYGVIDYDLSLASGTGIAEINDVWYEQRSFLTTDSVDISNFSLMRFAKSYSTSFLGASESGNIKGFKCDNLSSETIYLSLPFDGFNGNFRVPPSGSISISNNRGWTVSSGNATVNISGDTSTIKSYNLGFLGCSIPLQLRIGGDINIEYLASGNTLGSGLLNIDYLASSINSGITPIDYNIQNSSIDNILNLEYLLTQNIASGTGLGSSIPIDWISPSGFDNYLNIEWTGFASSSVATGTGCSGCGQELLINPTFQYGYVDESQVLDYWNGAQGDSGVCDPVVGIPGWEMSGIFLSGDSRNTGFIEYNGVFSLFPARRACKCRWPPYIGNSACGPGVGSMYPNYGMSYIRQTVQVIPGASYKLEWHPTEAQCVTFYDTPHPENNNRGTSNPSVRLLTSSGTILAQQIITNEWIANNTHTWQSLSGVAPGSSITVEFAHGASIYGESTGFSWSGDASRGRRVSFYRIR
jgi:hypothetical protein